MAWLTRLSLRNRALVGLASVLVAIFGVISMTSLKQELIPPLQIPIAAVVGPFPGASPAVVEQQVTAPVEAAVKAVPGVTGVESTSSGGKYHPDRRHQKRVDHRHAERRRPRRGDRRSAAAP
jgi:HAE1 family hydrophobic/amphiphilic exporter-1